MTLRDILITALALYVLAAIVIALTGDWLRRRGWDHIVSSYGALLIAGLTLLSCVAGPTLDNIHAQDGRGRTAYARR